MKRTVVTSIGFDNESVIITDPCYIKEFNYTHDSWNDFCDKMYGGKTISRMVPYEDSYIRKEFYANVVKDSDTDFIKNMIEYEASHYDPKRVLVYYIENNNCISSTTVVGDWACTVIDTDKNKQIGTFCADAGFVCVCRGSDFQMEDEKSDWLYTRINNYTGTVEIVMYEYEPGDNDYEEPLEPNGIINIKNMPNYYVCVEGHGSVNFKSTDMIYVI